MSELGIVIYRTSQAAWLRHSADWIQRLDPERARIWRWLADELAESEARAHAATIPGRRVHSNRRPATAAGTAGGDLAKPAGSGAVPVPVELR